MQCITSSDRPTKPSQPFPQTVKKNIKIQIVRMHFEVVYILPRQIKKSNEKKKWETSLGYKT